MITLLHKYVIYCIAVHILIYFTFIVLIIIYSHTYNNILYSTNTIAIGLDLNITHHTTSVRLSELY